MINFYLRHKTRKISSIPPSTNDIKKSAKILFSIFTRYGDTIIDLMIVKEFVKKYPNKEYLIICPKQMEPYVKELLPSINCKAFNKRNLFEMVKVIRLLKSERFDIGFNPWSNGLDSCYFISFCKKFLFYKDFDRPSNINHYQVVRKYLKLPEKNWKINELSLKENYTKILICPHSTDLNRNLPIKKMDQIIFELQNTYNRPEIVIASMDKSYFRDDCQKFMFEKSDQSSKQFLKLMRESSLVVCSDSGPLHIALALKKDLLAFMISTDPEIVINTGSCVIIQ
jgi:ADP-heptose:LPS heptosyltransferase